MTFVLPLSSSLVPPPPFWHAKIIVDIIKTLKNPIKFGRMLVFEKLLALACKISKIQAIFSIGLQSHTIYVYDAQGYRGRELVD